MSELKINKIHMGSAKCNVDLGDGSERADYVNQDYIINELGRPHRSIGLMYTYYPNDEQWPARISEACADMDVKFAWDYPYDDYFPYGANGEPFNQMRDIRKHGQDVMLTVTMDTKVSDEQLRTMARELKPFGRMRLRINHECNGNWFTHNKRNSYEEIGLFFERAAKIFHEEAPNISTIFCAGLTADVDEEVPYEKEFACAYREADIYSFDKYMALHYGWPYDVAEAGGGSYNAGCVEEIYGWFKTTCKRLNDRYSEGNPRKIILGEFNTDGDVTGGFLQPESIERFYNMVVSKDIDKNEGFLDGISMYQFRDKGRLGLEIEDPNNSSVGIKQPLFDSYKKIISQNYFLPEITVSEEQVIFPATLRWGGSEDADGIEIPVEITDVPVFCEVNYDEDASLMTEFLGKWFYKAPGVKTIDMMSVFYEAKREGRLEELMSRAADAKLRIWATPAEGVNPDYDTQDGSINYYGELKSAPDIRVRYIPCDTVR